MIIIICKMILSHIKSTVIYKIYCHIKDLLSYIRSITIQHFCCMNGKKVLIKCKIVTFIMVQPKAFFSVLSENKTAHYTYNTLRHHKVINTFFIDFDNIIYKRNCRNIKTHHKPKNTTNLKNTTRRHRLQKSNMVSLLWYCVCVLIVLF